MGEAERRMDMVRAPREEVLLDRKAVLGRDTSDVFRSKEPEHKGVMDPSAVAELLGTQNKFISETELVEVSQGRAVPDKPLAQILAEAKARKEEEFQEKWKIMKQGKNRPLEVEELEWLDSVLDAERRKELSWSAQEAAELQEFRQMQELLQHQQEELQGPTGGSRSADTQSKAKPSPAQQSKPVLKPTLKVKPVAHSIMCRPTVTQSDTAGQQQQPAETGEPISKRAKVADPHHASSAQLDVAPAVWPSVVSLVDYGSDSDSGT